MSIDGRRARGERFSFRADDGRSLTGRIWRGREGAERCVVFLPGIGTRQEYMHFVAAHLADAGWAAVTFDYRGVGASAGAEAEPVVLDHWIDLDIPAAVREARRRSGAQSVGVFAHSLGGQLLGLSPARESIDWAMTIGAQRGIPRLFRGGDRLRVEYAYAAFPILIRLLGRLPVSRFTFPVACPPGAVQQWVRWGRAGVFTDAAGTDVEHRFADYRGPLLAVAVSDDGYAPAAAVEALTRLFTRAQVRRETLRPSEWGLATLGHFGFFHRRTPRRLWAQTDAWLRALCASAGRAARAAVPREAHVASGRTIHAE